MPSQARKSCCLTLALEVKISTNWPSMNLKQALIICSPLFPPLGCPVEWATCELHRWGGAILVPRSLQGVGDSWRQGLCILPREREKERFKNMYKWERARVRDEVYQTVWRIWAASKAVKAEALKKKEMLPRPPPVMRAKVMWGERGTKIY